MKLKITNQGEQLITELLAGKSKLKFKELQLSDMDCGGTDIKILTELSNVKQTTGISSVKVKDQNTVELLAAVDNLKLNNGYYIKTLGVTVSLEDGRTILLAVGTDGENPSYLPGISEKTSTEIEYRLVLAIDDTAVINVTVDPGLVPTISMVEGKVDKEEGKGLSTNDFTDIYKNRIDKLDTDLSGKVDKEPGKGLSSNDYTDEEKLEVAKIKDQLVDLNNNQTIVGEKTFSKQIIASGGIQSTGDIQTTGDIRGGKVYNAVWNDLAEWFEKENFDDVFEPGDICSWNVSGVVLSNKKDKACFPIGVYSDSYGMILGGENRENMDLNVEKYVPIGLAGRVSVKVKGKVDIGDFITISSENGVGEKAMDDTPANYIIGVALESSNDNISKIKMLIK